MHPEYGHSNNQDLYQINEPPLVSGSQLLSEIARIEKLLLADEQFFACREEMSSIRRKIQKQLSESNEKADPALQGCLYHNITEPDFADNEDDSSNEPQESYRQRILIIDDDFETRYFIRNVLGEKYGIIESENGVAGFAMAGELFPDLIISDVVMPGMSGLDVCRKIKTEVSTSHIPVILLTGRSAAEQRLEGFEARADVYISKPFNPVELTLRVRNLLEMLHHQRNRYAHDIYQTPRQVTTNSTDEKFLYRIIKFVEENIDDPQLDISGLATELGMSASSLYRKVKSLTGMSSIDFVINHKMKYAAHLLLTGKYSVKEIAFMVGFTDARYFSTRFKKYFRYTPTEYVDSALQKDNQGSI